MYKPEELVHCAPPHPYVFLCPECDDPEFGNLKFYLRFGYSFTEQWGCVVTRHDFSRCPNCKETYVSTNGREPERAADEFKIRIRKKEGR